MGAVPETVGLDAAGILEAAANGRIDVLILLGADPLADFRRPVAGPAGPGRRPHGHRARHVPQRVGGARRCGASGRGVRRGRRHHHEHRGSGHRAQPEGHAARDGPARLDDGGRDSPPGSAATRASSSPSESCGTSWSSTPRRTGGVSRAALAGPDAVDGLAPRSHRHAERGVGADPSAGEERLLAAAGRRSRPVRPRHPAGALQSSSALAREPEVALTPSTPLRSGSSTALPSGSPPARVARGRRASSTPACLVAVP